MISLLQRLLARLEARAERRQKAAAARKERQWRELMPETAKLVDALDAHSLALIEEMEADENEIRDWTLILFGSDGARHEIPLRCSRKQIRKIKLAVFDASGDALAVPRDSSLRAAAPAAKQLTP